MKTDRIGDGEDLLFVMGWGNRVDGTNERWFATRLADEGYAVTLVELPTNPTDFERDYLDPVEEVAGGLDDPTVVSHSTGGLVAAYLEPERPLYVSPWWAFYGEKHRETVLELVSKLPLAKPFVPIDFDRDEIGPRVTDHGWDRLPKYVSPAFIGEIRSAQASMPSISDRAHVCCSLQDTIVGLHGVGERVSAERIHLYDGGHEPFSAADREAAASVVTDALARVEGRENV